VIIYVIGVILFCLILTQSSVSVGIENECTNPQLPCELNQFAASVAVFPDTYYPSEKRQSGEILIDMDFLPLYSFASKNIPDTTGFQYLTESSAVNLNDISYDRIYSDYGGNKYHLVYEGGRITQIQDISVVAYDPYLKLAAINKGETIDIVGTEAGNTLLTIDVGYQERYPRVQFLSADLVMVQKKLFRISTGDVLWNNESNCRTPEINGKVIATNLFVVNADDFVRYDLLGMKDTPVEKTEVFCIKKDYIECITREPDLSHTIRRFDFQGNKVDEIPIDMLPQEDLESVSKFDAILGTVDDKVFYCGGGTTYKLFDMTKKVLFEMTGLKATFFPGDESCFIRTSNGIFELDTNTGDVVREFVIGSSSLETSMLEMDTCKQTIRPQHAYSTDTFTASVLDSHFNILSSPTTIIENDADKFYSDGNSIISVNSKYNRSDKTTKVVIKRQPIGSYKSSFSYEHIFEEKLRSIEDWCCDSGIIYIPTETNNYISIDTRTGDVEEVVFESLEVFEKALYSNKIVANDSCLFLVSSRIDYSKKEITDQVIVIDKFTDTLVGTHSMTQSFQNGLKKDIVKTTDSHLILGRAGKTAVYNSTNCKFSMIDGYLKDISGGVVWFANVDGILSSYDLKTEETTTFGLNVSNEETPITISGDRVYVGGRVYNLSGDYIQNTGIKVGESQDSSPSEDESRFEILNSYFDTPTRAYVKLKECPTFSIRQVDTTIDSIEFEIKRTDDIFTPFSGYATIFAWNIGSQESAVPNPISKTVATVDLNSLPPGGTQRISFDLTNIDSNKVNSESTYLNPEVKYANSENPTGIKYFALVVQSGGLLDVANSELSDIDELKRPLFDGEIMNLDEQKAIVLTLWHIDE